MLSQIRGVNFDWVSNGKPSIGVIAQEIEKIAPSLIGDMQGYKTVNYSGIIGILIEAVKSLNEKIRRLEGGE